MPSSDPQGQPLQLMLLPAYACSTPAACLPAEQPTPMQQLQSELLSQIDGWHCWQVYEGQTYHHLQ